VTFENKPQIVRLAASEYNKGEVKQYSELYSDIPVLPKNLPSYLSPIEVRHVKLAWNESLFQVVKLLNNLPLSGKSDQSDDEDDVFNAAMSFYVG
jgi:hypothetical protein